MHPSQSFFTLLLTFIPLTISVVGALASSSFVLPPQFLSSPVDQRHALCTSTVLSQVLLTDVLNLRAAHAAHMETWGVWRRHDANKKARGYGREEGRSIVDIAVVVRDVSIVQVTGAKVEEGELSDMGTLLNG